MGKTYKNEILLNSKFFENSKIQNLLSSAFGNLCLVTYLRLLNLNITTILKKDLSTYDTDIEEMEELQKYQLANIRAEAIELIVLDEISLSNYKKNNDKNKAARKIIVNYLNQKLGTRYRPDSVNTKKHINARLDEGYKPDDFKTVIDKKCNDWIGTEYEKYLRPETLFGSKFESYLNQSGYTPVSKSKNLFLDEALEDGDFF